MDIKEAIRALSCFDEDHHIIVKHQNSYPNKDVELEIVQITFDGRNCVIEAEDD